METFEREELYRFYVKQRRKHCGWTERMDLSLLVPYSDTCALEDPWILNPSPDIMPGDWKTLLGHELGEQGRDRILRALEQNPDFAFRCWRCSERLRPWEGDSVHVETIHLEEHFSTPLYEPEQEGQKKPPKTVRSEVFRFYEGKCYRCEATEGLEIDHIHPRNPADGSPGGTAAFRNLQPLCRRCNEEKDDRPASEVRVTSTLFFGPYPNHAYEGLFWEV